MNFLFNLFVGFVLNVISYLLQPKPKQPKPGPAQDMEAPTADAGRPLPVLFGTMTIKGTNVLWYGDKQSYTYKISA